MKFTHARRIAGYNRLLYAGAGLGLLVGVVVTLLPRMPRALRWLAALAVAATAWLAGASFWAFQWMFDRSELLGGRWLTSEVPPPKRWVEINAGLEETTIPLEEVFPQAEGRMLDIYDPEAMTEPAITRARAERSAGSVVSARSDALPVESGWADLVLVMLAAHEIRDVRARERFFGELARIVAPGGDVVLVEHLRDLAATLTFGPGVFHFLPRQEWLRLAGISGMDVMRERNITPFIRVFVLRPRKTMPLTAPTQGGTS